jgi:hypothetical protein
VTLEKKQKIANLCNDIINHATFHHGLDEVFQQMNESTGEKKQVK